MYIYHDTFMIRLSIYNASSTWRRHQMETFSVLLALCAGNSPVTGDFPSQRPVTQSFDVFFDLRLNKRLNKHSRCWWFETPSRPLWHHCNDIRTLHLHSSDKGVAYTGYEWLLLKQMIVQQGSTGESRGEGSCKTFLGSWRKNVPTH